MRVLNAGARICKSDTLLPPDLLQRLASSVERLERLEQPGRLERREESTFPSSSSSPSSPSPPLPSLVDPICLPLVYDKTLILAEGGCVGLLDCVEFMGTRTAFAIDTMAPAHDRDPWRKDVTALFSTHSQ